MKYKYELILSNHLWYVKHPFVFGKFSQNKVKKLLQVKNKLKYVLSIFENAGVIGEKHYNLGVLTHKCVLEALLKLYWDEFVKWTKVKSSVRYIFASLFFRSKGEYLWNKEICFLFHFKSSFRSWENQILEF